MFPLHTTIPLVSPLFPLDTKKVGGRGYPWYDQSFHFGKDLVSPSLFVIPTGESAHFAASERRDRSWFSFGLSSTESPRLYWSSDNSFPSATSELRTFSVQLLYNIVFSLSLFPSIHCMSYNKNRGVGGAPFLMLTPARKTQDAGHPDTTVGAPTNRGKARRYISKEGFIPQRTRDGSAVPRLARNDGKREMWCVVVHSAAEWCRL